MSDNGILATIPGQYVAAALDQLGRPEAAANDTAECDMDVPGIGRVRFTATRRRAGRGRAKTYYWTADRAVLINAASAAGGVDARALN